MLAAAERRNVAGLRQPRRALRLALALWLVWAALVWNVVFDRVIVLAGRGYIAAATAAASADTPRYEDMDAWMRPAVTRGLWLATSIAAAILMTGIVLIYAASRTAAEPVSPCA
jgi:hypothetical protein